MLDAGVAETVAPLVELRFVFGLHEYAVAPEALKLAAEPAHMFCGAGAVTFGNAVTDTAIVFVLLQPFVVPVTVYVIGLVGDAVTAAPLVAFSAVVGDHA